MLLIPWVSGDAWAVPSFARQTGQPCASCHTAFPELTSFGRLFKLNGYTLSTSPNLPTNDPKVLLAATPPISAMMVIGLTHTSKALPEGAVNEDSENPDKKAENPTIQFPQELSLFYAGRIGEGIGTFTQLTYEATDDHFTIDNADLRFVSQSAMDSGQFIYGVTVNNSPTVQDLWNSTPVWGAPDMGSGVAPEPSSATLLDGTLGQLVVGVGGYGALSNSDGLWYAELTGYRSSQPGTDPPLNSSAEEPVIAGVAPYLRLAREMNFSSGATWEVGLIGLTADTYTPGQPVSGSATSTRTDLAVDTQYQMPMEEGSHLTAHAIYINESQKWDDNVGAEHSSDTLSTGRAWVDYNVKYSYLFTVLYFNTTGSKDAGVVEDSKNGSPNTSGVLAEAGYMPAENVRLAAQYTDYFQFNGSSSDYNGEGRNASDNNTLFISLWYVF